MKKLVIAAIAAAFAIGAFAGPCGETPCTETPTDGAWAYRWKFTGKTTKPARTTCNGEQFVTRVSASLKVQGYTFYCTPNCGDFSNLECDEVFWATKPSKVYFSADDARSLTFEVANVIGKSGKNYELAGKAAFGGIYDLTFAGLGKYDRKAARVNKVSGNFAGTATAPALEEAGSACGDPLPEVSMVWECCGCPTVEADSVAFGKFSVKFTKKYAKKYANGTLNMEKILPSWAR